MLQPRREWLSALSEGAYITFDVPPTYQADTQNIWAFLCVTEPTPPTPEDLAARDKLLCDDRSMFAGAIEGQKRATTNVIAMSWPRSYWKEGRERTIETALHMFVRVVWDWDR